MDRQLRLYPGGHENGTDPGRYTGGLTPVVWSQLLFWEPPVTLVAKRTSRTPLEAEQPDPVRLNAGTPTGAYVV